MKAPVRIEKVLYPINQARKLDLAGDSIRQALLMMDFTNPANEFFGENDALIGEMNEADTNILNHIIIKTSEGKEIVGVSNQGQGINIIPNDTNFAITLLEDMDSGNIGIALLKKGSKFSDGLLQDLSNPIVRADVAYFIFKLVGQVHIVDYQKYEVERTVLGKREETYVEVNADMSEVDAMNEELDKIDEQLMQDTLDKYEYDMAKVAEDLYEKGLISENAKKTLASLTGSVEITS